jgi:hypothetical protein
MYYRILRSPPGYLPSQNFMVAEYGTLDFASMRRNVRSGVGLLFFATIEDARGAIPGAARRLEYVPEFQLIELWESAGSGSGPVDKK